MSLSRLGTTFRSYMLDSLERLHSLPRETLLYTPNTPGGIKKVYIHNNALTVFSADTLYGSAADSVIANVRHCFEDGVRFVTSVDKDHDGMHQSHAEYEEMHYHLLKGHTEPHPLLSFKELDCILNDIKEFEKNKSFCADGKTKCLLSDSDQQTILENFEDYIQSRKLKEPNFAPIVDRVDAILLEVENRCAAGAKTFTHAFLGTFLDKYIKPYLINQYNDPKKAGWAVEIIRGAVTFGLCESLLSTTLNLIIRTGLKTGLEKVGMNPDSVDKIVTEISSVILFTQNPLALVELGINGSAAAAGQAAAYSVIRALPKLKYEAELAEPVAHKDTQCVNPPGLRRRSPSHNK